MRERSTEQQVSVPPVYWLNQYLLFQPASTSILVATSISPEQWTPSMLERVRVYEYIEARRAMDAGEVDGAAGRGYRRYMGSNVASSFTLTRAHGSKNAQQDACTLSSTCARALTGRFRFLFF